MCVGDGVMVQVFGKGGAVIARLIWDGDFLFHRFFDIIITFGK